MLHGDLVTLRAFQPSDADAFAAYANDVETELLSGGAAPSPTTRETIVERWEQRRTGRDAVPMVIEADGRPIGDVALFNIDHLSHRAELGITIGDKDYWGRGYGTEAVRLIVDYGFRMRNLRKIWLQTLANNPRAIAAYAKAGFVEEGRLREHDWVGGSYVDLVQMGILREGR